MKLKHKNVALAAGLTAAIMTFIKKAIYMLMFWSCQMPVGKIAKKGMMLHRGWRYRMMPEWLPKPVWMLVVKPLMAFIVAAFAAWIFVYFFNRFEKRKK